MPKIKIALVVFSFIFLVSCSSYEYVKDTFNTIDNELSLMHGQNIDQLIDKIGYPTDEKIVAEKKLYIWNRRWLRSSGDGGSDTLFCTITVEVNKSDTIIDHETKGNFYGCYYYCLELAQKEERAEKCPNEWSWLPGRN